MSDLTPTQRASGEMWARVMSDPATRAKFERMRGETAGRQPVPDDFGWLSPALSPAAGHDRVSLHPLDPKEALRSMLATPPSKRQED